LVGGEARLNPIVTFVRKQITRGKNKGKLSKRVKKIAQEFYYPSGGGRILKTTQSGRDFATPSDQIFRWDGDIYFFKYDVDITYFKINDLDAGHAPTAPWAAFDAGQRAYEDYLNNFLIPGLPEPTDFLIGISVNK